MARAATTADAFNAVAEPRRREIVELLGDSELSVNQIVEAIALPQPLVSKHLKVLREVGLVESRAEGRFRLYRLNATKLKPIHDWVVEFERLWNERLDRLDDYLGEIQGKDSM